MSNTTHKQQGAHQHLIYVRAQEQHCISLIYFCIIRGFVMIFWFLCLENYFIFALCFE